MRYLGVVKYKGTNFCGWQSQTEAALPSVQQEIETILSKLLVDEIKIFGSGRTDAGVHALAQTFSFDVEKKLDTEKLIYAFNQLVNKDIALQSLVPVQGEFHARYSAKAKSYVYKISMSKIKDPFLNDEVLQLHSKLDIDKMKVAGEIFVGTHNYQNFTTKEEDKDDFVRTIYSVEFGVSKEILKIRIKGNGFMRYMVRMIVGTLIQVGLGKLEIDEIIPIFKQTPRKPCSFKAPAEGLYLEKVYY